MIEVPLTVLVLLAVTIIIAFWGAITIPKHQHKDAAPYAFILSVLTCSLSVTASHLPGAWVFILSAIGYGIAAFTQYSAIDNCAECENQKKLRQNEITQTKEVE